MNEPQPTYPAGEPEVLTEFVPVERAELARLREDSALLAQIAGTAGRMRYALETIRKATAPEMVVPPDLGTCSYTFGHVYGHALLGLGLMPARPPLPPHCFDCGLPYDQFGLDVTLPNEQWRMVHPDVDGLLCATCIVKRAGRLNQFVAARMLLDPGPGAR